MAILDLPTQEMVTITLGWLDPERQRAIIERCARVAPLLEDVAEAHNGLLEFQHKAKRESDLLPKLRAETTALDNHHDRIARVINHLLLGLIELNDEPAQTDAFVKLRTELFPEGLDINLKSYLAQAGDADMREKRISESSKKLLETTCIHIGGREQSLRDLVDEWGDVARKLGQVEAEKIRVQSGEASEGSIGPARRAWARIVSLFLQMLDLEQGLTDAERRALLEPLRNAEAKAKRKRALARKKNQPFSPDAPDEPGDEAGGEED